MCLAIPAEIVELNGDVARCRIGDTETYMQVSVMLLPERPALGDYVIVHAGFAMHALDRGEALETIRILRDMADLLADTGQAGHG